MIDAPRPAPRLRVSCLRDAAAVATQWTATHVVSLLDPDLEDHRIPRIAAPVRHDVFRFYDQERADATRQFDTLVGAVLEVVIPALAEPGARLLIHCHAGVSRSTAVAYGALAHLHGTGRETDAFMDLLAITRKPWPNRRVVEVIDTLRGHDGRLLAPLDAYRADNPRRLDAYRRFNRSRGLVSTVPR